MKVKLYTLEGTETLEGIAKIIDFGSNIVFATDDGIEYDSSNDFPTMYRFEVTPFHSSGE